MSAHTVEDILRTIAANLRLPPKPDTLDTLKCGDPKAHVRGIAVTFMATMEILQKAVELDCNLVITHEPTFYNHRDETQWLVDDAIYQAKRAFIERSSLAVFRFHDGIHLLSPDGIREGVREQLGWQLPADPQFPSVCDISPLTLEELVGYCKHRLHVDRVRVAGDLKMICRKVGLMVGAAGGRRQIELLQKSSADVVLCGESPEWETCEYVRDASAIGINKGLIVLGHANSEEPGIRWAADWLRGLLPPGIPIHHLAAGDPFRSI